MKYVSKKILFFRIKLMLLIFITSIIYSSVFPDHYSFFRNVTFGLFILWDLYHQKNNMEDIVEHYRQNYDLEGAALDYKVKRWEKINFRIQFSLGIFIIILGVLDVLFTNNMKVFSNIKTVAFVMDIFCIVLFIFSKRLFNSLPEGYPRKTNGMFILVRASIVGLFIFFLAIFIKFY